MPGVPRAGIVVANRWGGEGISELEHHHDLPDARGVGKVIGRGNIRGFPCGKERIGTEPIDDLVGSIRLAVNRRDRAAGDDLGSIAGQVGADQSLEVDLYFYRGHAVVGAEDQDQFIVGGMGCVEPGGDPINKVLDVGIGLQNRGGDVR